MLATRPARQSALGVTWCEDFSRGRLGVRKQGGEFLGSAALDGEWVRLPGGSDSYVRYPKVQLQGATALTVVVPYCNCPAGSTTWSWLLTQYKNATHREFGIQIRPSDGRIYFYLTINGTTQNVSFPSLDFVTPGLRHEFVGTWESGGNLKMYVDGVYKDQAGPYAGTLGDNPNIAYLCVGAQNDGGTSSECDLGGPIVDLARAWSETEIRALYNRSLL